MFSSEVLLKIKHLLLHVLVAQYSPSVLSSFLPAAGKEQVQQSYKDGTLDAFNGRDAPWGHGPTNTTKWVRLARPILYRVQYESKYEPFIILSRRLAPWADERFVGYGGNKIAYINQLSGLDFGFHVHPYGFVIHVPHVRTRAANLFVLHKQRGHADMEALRLEVESEIEKGSYVPVTDGCKKELEEEGDGDEILEEQETSFEKQESEEQQQRQAEEQPQKEEKEEEVVVKTQKDKQPQEKAEKNKGEARNRKRGEGKKAQVPSADELIADKDAEE